MKYILIAFLLLFSIYPFSYAGYNWKNNNKFGAIGVILLALAAIVYPSILLLIRG